MLCAGGGAGRPEAYCLLGLKNTALSEKGVWNVGLLLQAGLHQVLGGAMTFLTDLKAAEDEEQQRRNAPESSDEEYDEAVSERASLPFHSLLSSNMGLDACLVSERRQTSAHHRVKTASFGLPV